MVDYSDVIDLQRRRSAALRPSLAELEAHRRTQGMVALRMESLQNGDDWGVYRAHITALLEATEAADAAIRQQIDDGQLVGDDLARANLRRQRLLGRLDAYREALALPQTIQDHAEAEKKALDVTPGVEGKA